MKEFKHIIQDPVGIHARPAGLLAKEIKKYQSTVTVHKGEKSCKATSVIQLMGMGIVQGDEITVRVEGEDEAACAAAIEQYMGANL